MTTYLTEWSWAKWVKSRGSLELIARLSAWMKRSIHRGGLYSGALPGGVFSHCDPKIQAQHSKYIIKGYILSAFPRGSSYKAPVIWRKNVRLSASWPHWSKVRPRTSQACTSRVFHFHQPSTSTGLDAFIYITSVNIKSYVAAAKNVLGSMPDIRASWWSNKKLLDK